MEREIIVEVRKIISMLRNIIENDKYLLSLIDEDYEQINDAVLIKINRNIRLLKLMLMSLEVV